MFKLADLEGQRSRKKTGAYEFTGRLGLLDGVGLGNLDNTKLVVVFDRIHEQIEAAHRAKFFRLLNGSRSPAAYPAGSNYFI